MPADPLQPFFELIGIIERGNYVMVHVINDIHHVPTPHIEELWPQSTEKVSQHVHILCFHCKFDIKCSFTWWHEQVIDIWLMDAGDSCLWEVKHLELMWGMEVLLGCIFNIHKQEGYVPLRCQETALEEFMESSSDYQSTHVGEQCTVSVLCGAALTCQVQGSLHYVGWYSA